jgi:hypothetical protein
VYPGPLHYAGDVLSIEVIIENMDRLPDATAATLSIDDRPPLPIVPFVAYSPLRENALDFRWAWDTTDQAGLHSLTITVPIDKQGTTQKLDTHIEILPAEEHPKQEQGAVWVERILPCCRVDYITHTAAARDINKLSDRITNSVATLERKIEFPMSGKPIPIVLIDNMWGNGAFTSSDVVISYVDRDYVSINIDNIIRHEGAHYAMRPLEHQTPLILMEGVAVYAADGHYKPEPIPERASALLVLDRYVPLTELTEDFYSHQHEAAYIEAAGLVSYLTETYGWAKFLNLYSTEDLESTGADWLDQALDLTYGKRLSEVEVDYKAWLQQHPPGEQVEDLRLTIDLLDTVRQYEALYAPYEESLPSVEEAKREGATAEFIREPSAPENVALEALLAQAGRDLEDGSYASCEAIIKAVSATLTNQDFTQPPVSDYLAIAREVASQGYEAQRIDILGNQATVRAIRTWPRLETLTLFFDGTTWRLKPTANIELTRNTNWANIQTR